MFKSIVKTIFAITIVVGLLYFVAYEETHYSKTGTIVQQNGVSIFTDHHGNEYGFYSDEKIPANANVQVRFFTNNTLDNIYDDMVIDYKIIGYTDEIRIDF